MSFLSVDSYMHKFEIYFLHIFSNICLKCVVSIRILANRLFAKDTHQKVNQSEFNFLLKQIFLDIFLR